MALLFLFPPEEVPYWPKCLLHQITGIYCPGCGSTRALAALLHGNLAKSISYNLLLIPGLLTLMVILCHPRLLSKRHFIWTAVAIILVFGILRNLPWQPFCLLAPH